MVDHENIKVDDEGHIGKADPPSASQPNDGLLSSMNTGYVKIYRSLWEKGYWFDSEYVHLWVHLIMKATYRPKEYLFNGKIQHLLPGQFIAGRKKLSEETGIQESKIERILYCFTTEHQIEQQTTNKFRIITICNWSKYQTDEQQNEQQMNNQRTTSEHKQERKEYKEKKIIKGNGIFHPPDLNTVVAYCLERQNSVDPEKWHNFYSSNGWKVGRNPMKDWKAAVRTWEKSEFNKPRIDPFKGAI